MAICNRCGDAFGHKMQCPTNFYPIGQQAKTQGCDDCKELRKELKAIKGQLDLITSQTLAVAVARGGV